MKIAICDDEKKLRKDLRHLLELHLDLKGIPYEIQEYESGDALLKDEHKEDIQLLFLDIEMPETDGFELAGKIREEAPGAYLIFLTSHEELAMEGYHFKAFAYIPKSLLEKEMSSTLQRFWAEYQDTYCKVYPIITDTRFERLDYDDIIYFYKEKNNTVFVLKDREVHIRKSLKDVFDELASEEFMFTERGYVVNIEHIVRLVKKGLIVSNGKEVPIGRTYEMKVKKAILHFWKDRI